jgi:uncharacterized protein YciI
LYNLNQKYLDLSSTGILRYAGIHNIIFLCGFFLHQSIVMFIVELTYKKELTDIDLHIEAHKNFLRKYYSSKHFIVSGRKSPRTGGIILVNAVNQQEIQEIITEDPFYKNDLANYTITEFIPTMSQNGFEFLLS